MIVLNFSILLYLQQNYTMKPILVAGVVIVNLALISYSVGIITQLLTKKISRKVLFFVSMGLVFDITATICMIAGSSNGMITWHGLIGYSSLLGMLLDIWFSYRYINKSGINTNPGKKFNTWSATAYIYWVIAYITGAIIVMVN
jgi:hypothetical protein